MRRTRSVWIGAMVVLLVALFAVTAAATVSEMYFASDPNGQNRVTNIQEGDEVWICVYDLDQNIDCDFPGKIWVNLMVFDPKTGGCIPWDNGGYTGIDGDLAKDYLEETGGDTGLFVSKHAFRIGGRTSSTDWTHDPGDLGDGADLYIDGVYTQLETPGRVENMDTLVGMYQDPNDSTDVAVSLLKIIDTEATISWDQMIYADPHTSATITIVDLDENIDCNEIEKVPVFIIVNPGSWNPVRQNSATNFCMLKRYGGVDPVTGNALNKPMRWYNIYDSGLGNPYLNNGQSTNDGAYYLEYPTSGDGNVVSFDTADPNGFCRVVFYARETGNDTGVFQVHMNDILDGLGLNSLDVRDVLVAYYLDPNDFDDFKLATAYVEEHQHSITSFTDAAGVEQSEYWIGRNSAYVQVIDSNANVDPGSPEQIVVHICDPRGEDDAEWIILDETSSNSPVFFLSDEVLTLLPVWNALGREDPGPGGYGLQLDNWELEVYNEDSIYVRYNDVYYENDTTGMSGLGDADVSTAFPPEISTIRVNNDVSFDVIEVTDTQVYDNSSVHMYFLNRYGDRVSGYTNGDCAFIEIVDPDQNEDQSARDRIDGFWDGQQESFLGPMDFEDNHGACGFGYNDVREHPVNPLLGDTNIFASGYSGNPSDSTSWAKIYVLNPRNGRWAAVDLLETGVNTGHFVSVSCVDLISVYDYVPTLGVLPGDTIIAVYQDPSNHSDTAWISTKIRIGGGGPPGGPSTTTFTNSVGMDVDSYTEYENIYVKVVDPSHTGATNILNAVELEGMYFDLTPLPVAPNDTFITGAISQEALGISVGDSITATYTDPINPADISSDTASIVAATCATVCTNLTPAGWQMIALPGDLSGCPCGDEYGSVCCAICDDLDPCYIFHYDPVIGGYIMVPPCETLDYQAGMGFWVRTYEAPVDICADVRLVMDAQCVPLEPGWTQIGNPFPFEVSLGDLVVKYQGNALSLEQAQVNGWISMYLFGYDTASGGYAMIYPPDGVLQPWTGYWIRAYVNCEICIPPIPAPPVPPSALVQPKDLGLKDIPTPPPPPEMQGEMDKDALSGLVVRNLPNPVRSQHTTTFKVEGKTANLVQAMRVEIYNQSGQKVFTQDINAKELEWHTDNEAGELLANGVYLYQVWVKIGGEWYPTGVHKLAVVR